MLKFLSIFIGLFFMLTPCSVKSSISKMISENDMMIKNSSPNKTTISKQNLVCSWFSEVQTKSAKQNIVAVLDYFEPSFEWKSQIYSQNVAVQFHELEKFSPKLYLLYVCLKISEPKMAFLS